MGADSFIGRESSRTSVPNPIPLTMAALRAHLQSLLGDTYRVERELAGGGMSRLFLATERALRRPVVIKILPRELTSEVTAARFQREIELAAQLQHPHILPIHAAGSRDGLLYYVMPYIPGESLRGKLARDGRLAVGDAVRVLDEVADSLAYAHRSGVVHRDIKPENILLSHGHALLADFGIARALAGGATGGRITGTGISVGTPGYMAPEQAAGDAHVDARADVYALAVVGYEMLAGTLPFAGHTPREMIAAQFTGDPRPLHELRPDAPRAVSDAIHHAMAREPERRFRTAAEFREAMASAGGRDSAARQLGEDESQPGQRVTDADNGSTRRGWLGSVRRALRRLGVGGEAPPHPGTSPPVSRCSVAVLPFSVRGSEKLAYLGDGLVELLSTKLDGLEDFCTTDPRAVLSVVAREGRREYDPDAGRRIARQLGAGRFILGSLVEAGGRLQLSATLYEATGAVRSSARATADDESRIFSLVDELCIKLLAGEPWVSTAPHVTRIEATTTGCLDALKAYLEGERHFRSGRFTAAKEAFGRAVELDGSFALAWYRLSVAAEWMSDRELQERAAERALEHSTRLSEHDRLLLDAFVAWRRGSPSAEGLYRNIVATYPNDVDAWFQLGEVLFHHGPLCGRSIVHSREAWERILAVEPDHLMALHHLQRVAAVEGNTAELGTITERVLALSPSNERALEVRALRAAALRDEAEFRQVLRELRGASDVTVIVAIRTVASCSGHLDGAAALARLLAEPSRAPAIRALAAVQLAFLETARGQWSAAREALADAASFDEALALPARGLLASLPFLEIPRAELEDAREALAAWDACAVARTESASMYLRIHDGLHAHVRAHTLGVLCARLGDDAAAHRQATELAGLGTSAAERALARALSDSVHALVASQRGERAAALATLERARLETSYELPLASPFYSRAFDRYLRAGLLVDAGRLDEADAWYASIAEISVYDAVYAAPAQQRRAELAMRRGDVSAAAYGAGPPAQRT